MATEIPKLYREYQQQSALVASKEQALQAKRAAFEELRRQVQQEEEETQRRQQHASQEQEKLRRAESEFNDRQALKANRIMELQNALSALEQEDVALQRQTQKMDAENHANIEKINNLHRAGSASESVAAELAALQRSLETQVAVVKRYEEKANAKEAAAKNRYAAYGDNEDAKKYPLPSKAMIAHSNVDSSSPQEDLMMDSMVLLDDTSM